MSQQRTHFVIAISRADYKRLEQLKTPKENSFALVVRKLIDDNKTDAQGANLSESNSQPTKEENYYKKQ